MLARLLARVGLVTPEQRAWASYDDDFHLLHHVVTRFLSQRCTDLSVSGLEQAQATARFAAVPTASSQVVAVVVADPRRDRGREAGSRGLLVGFMLVERRIVRPRWSSSSASIGSSRRWLLVVGDVGVSWHGGGLRCAAGARGAAREGRSHVRVERESRSAISGAAFSCW